ncbi:hypothetical protein HYX10_06560 [Candidatus Woesearchaeota archaeon]|nr:hypothetical protein [Candidatus Woesearchaeota archaeon]
MGKILAFALFVMLLLSFSSSALAEKQHKNILLNRIVILDDNPLAASVSVKNINERSADRLFDFDGGKVIVSVPELALRSSGRIEVGEDKRSSRKVLLDFPEGIKGDYYLRIVVINDDVRRVRHRLITI